MPKMNSNRAHGGDDDFAAVGDEPTIKARYAGTCATCGARFAVGDPIASIRVDKKSTYHHAACRYPATALLAQNSTAFDAETVSDARHQTGKCRATTKKGKPCANGSQKGEQFCGPHLTQAASRGAQENASD